MGTRFQPYPTYQASDISWYKAAPVHWQAERFKYALSQKQKTPNNQLGAGSISFGRVIFKDSESIPSETLASYQEVLAGEFLINPLNMNYDLISLRTALSTINVVVSTGYIVLQCAGLLDKEFTKWLLHEFDVAHMKTLGSGVRQTITYADIGNSYFLKPPLSEQTQIATFLDRETAKIDRLIEKQQRLIKLLEEKRQAVISHAVTKGLNPDVPMKDSGVEWLGDVPEHWQCKSLNYLLTHIVDNRGRTPSIVDLGIPMCEVKQVAGNGFYTSSNYEKYVTDETYHDFVRSDVQENDILFVTVGATFGKTCLVPENPDFFIAQNLVGFRCKNDIDPKFLMLLLSSAAFKEAMSATNKSSTIDNIKVSDLIKTRVAIPDLVEQKIISTRLFKMLGRFDEIKQKSQAASRLLNERRTALISAAVTGKIDVRNQVPQDVEEAVAS